ncbi:MAG: tRNA 2-thiouridine(34) synthase MnmA [Leptospiraceae bacterium]|nr:tRNA 2-thiouridine(34) synthase MnmA [Leptospiraceae bacterium]MCK6381624.1 tRNA 2-thiouridine(34) synthase MnmA [Leptospiraceae bacterium]NUM40817.1 tRNA 2-thiouridine(34) synthase MnmA [Leptospiraceae bacterium]
MTKKNKERIVVAMSGGVDSSVAAGILLEEGYEVIGVNIRTWDYESGACNPKKKSCCSPEDVSDARSVGLRLNIPFYIVKMEEVFQKRVIDRFINDYQDGLTPNPCVECNTFVKFGALFQKAKALGISKIATGHYAKIKSVNGRYAVSFGADSKKNQAYYLYGLSQDNLANTIFPLGNMQKEEVRSIARKYNLSVAEKLESQEICFIPENDYRVFLKKKDVQFTSGYFKLVNGKVIGEHSGKENFTIGQRKGLGISWSTPLFVISIEDDGTVILGEESEMYSESFRVGSINFQGMEPKMKNHSLRCRVQIRYRHKPIECLVSFEENSCSVTPLENVKGVTPGQSAVFFPLEGDYILFGGTIEKTGIQRKSLKKIN